MRRSMFFGDGVAFLAAAVAATRANAALQPRLQQSQEVWSATGTWNPTTVPSGDYYIQWLAANNVKVDFDSASGNKTACRLLMGSSTTGAELHFTSTAGTLTVDSGTSTNFVGIGASVTNTVGYRQLTMDGGTLTLNTGSTTWLGLGGPILWRLDILGDIWNGVGHHRQRRRQHGDSQRPRRRHRIGRICGNNGHGHARRQWRNRQCDHRRFSTYGTNTVTVENGGTLSLNSFSYVGTGTLSGTYALNLNGGTLKARQNNTSFLTGLTTNVKDNGATVDTGAYNITIAQSLQHGGTNATDGGLTKLGAGTLTLSGTNTYTGPTTVSNGTLALPKEVSLYNNNSGGVVGPPRTSPWLPVRPPFSTSAERASSPLPIFRLSAV